MALWLAVCLPALPLQLAARAIRCAGPLAITEGPREQPLIAFCNDPARASGLPARDAQAGGQLQPALAPLPLTMLEWDVDTTRTLHALGLNTIGQVLGLPRDAFARRFGAHRLDQLDRALGLQPDPQPAFSPPARFAARIELPADVTQSAQLMFPAHRLLRSLEGFLRGHDAGAAELIFTAHHNPRGVRTITATRIALALAAPERDAGRLAKLLAERLTRVSLPEPAVELSLTVERLAPFQALNASL